MLICLLMSLRKNFRLEIRRPALQVNQGVLLDLLLVSNLASIGAARYMEDRRFGTQAAGKHGSACHAGNICVSEVVFHDQSVLLTCIHLSASSARALLFRINQVKRGQLQKRLKRGWGWKCPDAPGRRTTSLFIACATVWLGWSRML
jgi:hypothetical protein